MFENAIFQISCVNILSENVEALFIYVLYKSILMSKFTSLMDE